MMLASLTLSSSLARAAVEEERGRPACAAPTPLSTTGPNILLVGDSISMGGSGSVAIFDDPGRSLRLLARRSTVVLPQRVAGAGTRSSCRI